MGEYATRKTDAIRIKIGTCEDMYYLRFDQREQVTAERGNVDPIADVAALRFRFPFPDEDTIAPGMFENYGRSIPIHGFTAPADADHNSVQFTADIGYLVSLPCPEGTNGDPALTIHRNGFSGAVHLVAQKYREGIGLVPILRCGGCGTMWREEDRARIEEIAVLLRSEGDSRVRQSRDRNPAEGKFWHDVADRVLAGLLVTA